jgi:hypothetical protein
MGMLGYLQESAHLPNFAQISKIQYFFLYKFCLENYVAEIYIPEIMYTYKKGIFQTYSLKSVWSDFKR